LNNVKKTNFRTAWISMLVKPVNQLGLSGQSWLNNKDLFK